MQFKCATNWMGSSIPKYSKRVASVHNLMEQVYKKVGKRTKRAVSKVPLTELLGQDHDATFAVMNQQLG